MAAIEASEMQIEYYIRQRIEDNLDEVILPHIEQLVNETNLCESRLGRAQFSSLQNLLRETNSIQVVLNWIAYQMGRYAAWREKDFGSKLLVALNGLEGIAKTITAELYASLETEETNFDTLFQNEIQVRRRFREIWKRLIEQYVGQLYRRVVACKGMGS